MSGQSDRTTELTPEAVQVLEDILEQTKLLTELSLGDIAPAAVFQAD